MPLFYFKNHNGDTMIRKPVLISSLKKKSCPIKIKTMASVPWGALIYLISMIILMSPCSASEISHYSLENFSGRTMGTTYHIKVSMPLDEKSTIHSSSHIKIKQQLKEAIDHTLKGVNQSMSIYSPTSEISRFNQSSGPASTTATPTNDVKRSNDLTSINALPTRNPSLSPPFPISSDFYRVMQTGQTLYRLTDGAWDATLKPLIDLWGFGTKNQRKTLPSPKMIQSLIQQIGFNHIIISGPDTRPHILQKRIHPISLDLGSIAKGFGVDTVADLLSTHGYHNYLVEIGGEVVTAGEKRIGKAEEPGKAWIVGINRPDKGGNPNAVYLSFPLSEGALATSGDYRNFYEIEGKTYSHIIDPVSGYPVDNGVVSTSVIAPDCTFADGLATALMVMGAKKGIDLVNRIEKTEALIVVRDEAGTLTDHYSAHFPGQPNL